MVANIVACGITRDQALRRRKCFVSTISKGFLQRLGRDTLCRIVRDSDTPWLQV
jgi:hypothetical protein